MGSITCGRCHNTHTSVQQVRDCYAGITASVAAATAPVKEVRRITDPQMKFIKDLGGDLSRAYRMNTKQASDYITQLKKDRGKSPVTQHPATTAPNRRMTKVPIAMLQSVPDGRYAVRQDSNHPYTFFRISRPKTGKYSGSLKIQTQHGEDYDLMMSVWPSGSVTVYDKRWEDDLLLVCVDPNGAGIAYGHEIGRCMRCGKELTDERSRYYGIGPECEKIRPDIIALVNAEKGVFQFGQ